MGAVSTTACSGRWFTVNGSFILHRSVSFKPEHITCRSGLFKHRSIDDIVAIRMLKRIVATMTIASLCLLVLLLNVTVPTSVGPFGILAVFIFAYLSSLGVMTFFIYGVSRIIAHLSITLTVKRPVTALPFRRAYYYSTVIAAGPIMLIGLQSVGSVGVYQVLLVLLFEIIGCVYITKRIH